MAGEEEKEGALLKRKKEGDGPRGMAWGAQSAAAARISKIREKDPESNSDFGRYFAEKRRKLNVQFNEDSSNKLLSGATAAVAALHSKEGEIVVAEISTKSRLFNGISIWVDGFTIPSHQELRHLMLQYGGVFENYFKRDLVTHIICSTLPDSKIKNPRSLSRGLPIVQPEWIVDSISAGRVLSWAPYQLERIALEHPNQRTLQSTYSNPKLVHNPLPLDWRDGRDDGDSGAQLDLLALENVHSTEKPGPSSSQVFQAEELEKAEGQSAEIPVEEAPSVEEVSVSVTGRNNRKTSTGHSDANRTHSTLGDKNFVQNYFKASRLHFIGTWRNRYQSRYGSSSKGDGQEHQNFRANSGGDPAIIHIDMDCFFVAVVVRDRPELNGKPVAVCHSDSARGTGEISSANYPARAFGVRAGTFVRDAKEKCPDLEIVPYNFEAYEQVADKVYDILHHHCGRVQAVSCDEAFLDVTGQGDPCKIASMIRSQIFEATRCTASAGVSGNMLLARLATRKAKPNGQYFIAPSQVEDFLAELAVEDLPGVGWTLKKKLHSHNLRKCPDLRRVSKDFLQREFGVKTGDMLWSYARGIDIREVQPAQERKSIGAEVNWGVRFLVPEDAQRFLVTLSTEVATRLQTAAAKGRTITLKVKKRKEGAGEPYKFMGCGICDNFSRSETVAYATDSQEVLLRVAKQLFNSFAFDVREVRGVGLQVTRLEAVGSGYSLKGGQGQQRALESWLAPETTKVLLNEGISVDQKPGHDTRSPEVEPAEAVSMALEAPKLLFDQNHSRMQAESSLQQPHTGPSTSTVCPGDSKKFTTGSSAVKGSKGTRKVIKKPAPTATTNLPTLSELDPSVLASLPPEILAEIQEIYGELPVPEKSGEKRSSAKSSEPALSVETPKNGGRKEALACETRTERGESSRPSSSSVNPEIVALPPASQLDPSVMAALPLSLRRELEREYNLQKQVKKPKKEPVPKFKAEKAPELPVSEQSDGRNSTSLEDLWFGSPPKWVKLFKNYKGPEFSNLCVLAEHMPSELGPFSTVLLSLLPQLSSICGVPVNESVIHSCVELFKQYAQQVIAHDLEEVCMMLRILRRAAANSQLWRIVEELTIPLVQWFITPIFPNTWIFNNEPHIQDQILAKAMADMTGKVITCKAGVAYEPNKPLSFEDVHCAPPHPTEVRVKITNACICQSDLYFWKGKDAQKLFPRIMGHEGAGICESIGAQIKHIKPGDKCIPVWQCECMRCAKCKSPKTNICDVFMFNWGSGLMPSDKATTRFTRVEDGKPIYHFFGISVFSQYSTMDEACVAKINAKADLTKVCLLGCGIPTGVGSVWNICKVHQGSTVAVFGLGTIGLAVVEACKVSGCSKIIGIARDDGKLERAMEFGLTHTLNTKSYDKPIEEVIRTMTNGGVDYSFDCTGDPSIIKSALECCLEWGGVSCILGLVESSQRLAFHPASLLWGRVWTSGLFGGYKGRSQLPTLVDQCIAGRINLDHYITHKLPFSKIQEAFDLLNTGGCIRCVMDYDN